MFCEECAKIIAKEILKIEKTKVLIAADIFTRKSCYNEEEWLDLKLEIKGREEKIKEFLNYYENRKNKNKNIVFFHDVYFKGGNAIIIDFQLYQFFDQYHKNEFMRIHNKNGAYACFVLRKVVEKLKIENQKLKNELYLKENKKKEKVYIIATSRADPFEIEKMKGKGKKWKVEKYEREKRERQLRKAEQERNNLENVDNPGH